MSRASEDHIGKLTFSQIYHFNWNGILTTTQRIIGQVILPKKNQHDYRASALLMEVE
jgi:hypothetical protein